MQRLVIPAILSVVTLTTASAGPLSPNPSNQPARGAPPADIVGPAPAEATQVRPVNSPNLGGGFLEMLFGGSGNAAPRYEPNPIVMPHERQAPGYRYQLDQSDDGY